MFQTALDQPDTLLTGVASSIGTAPPRWADRAVAIATLVLLVGVGYSLWCDSPLIWDGAYQLYETLINGRAYAYLSRFHTLIIWQPVAWLSWHTDNVKLLTIVYGAPFLLAPVVGLVTCWWFVRRHAPMMIVWAAIGLLAAPLPGQIFVINDSVFQQHLFWPVLLGLMVPLSWQKKVVLVGLAIFQGVHQIGAVLTFGLTAGLVLHALIEARPAERKRLWFRAGFAGLLLVLTLTKTWWISVPNRPFWDYYDSYAAQEATWERVREAWLYGVEGFPLQGLVLAYVAGLALFVQWALARRGKGVRADLLSYVAAICLLGTAAFWLYWASVPGFWTSAINYRRWVVPLAVPAYTLAIGEMAVRRWSASRGVGLFDGGPPPRTTLIARNGVVIGLACLFVVVLGMQSTQYKHDSDRLQAEVMASPHATVVCGPSHWMHVTPLENWGTGWQVLLRQGKRPQKWLVGGDALLTDDRTREKYLGLLDGPSPQLPIASFTPRGTTPGPTGWLDLRDVIPAARKERASGLPGLAPPTTRPAADFKLPE